MKLTGNESLQDYCNPLTTRVSLKNLTDLLYRADYIARVTSGYGAESLQGYYSPAIKKVRRQGLLSKTSQIHYTALRKTVRRQGLLSKTLHLYHNTGITNATDLRLCVLRYELQLKNPTFLA